MTSPRIWETVENSVSGHAALLCPPVLPHRTSMYASVRSSGTPSILPTGRIFQGKNAKSGVSTARIACGAGFSLIELLIVMALVGVIAGFAMSFSMSSIARSNAQSERDMLVSLLTQARTRAIANINESAHGVYVDTINQRYVSYAKKGGCTSATTSTTNIPFQTPATFTDHLDRCFGQLWLRVATAQTGTTTISLAGTSYAIAVNSVGRIDW